LHEAEEDGDEDEGADDYAGDDRISVDLLAWVLSLRLCLYALAIAF
jgi:hypothetical protein